MSDRMVVTPASAFGMWMSDEEKKPAWRVVGCTLIEGPPWPFSVEWSVVGVGIVDCLGMGWRISHTQLVLLYAE